MTVLRRIEPGDGDAQTRPRSANGGLVPDAPPAGYFEALLADADEAVSPIVPESFHPIDLKPVLAGRVSAPEPTILRRDDGQCLLYPGQVNGLHGDSGIGKGWVVHHAAVQQLAGGRHVMILDLEDVPSSIVARLRQLGATDAAIEERLIYVRPTESFGPFAVEHLVSLVVRRRVSLVVIDSLGEAFGLDGIDENHDAEVGPWLRRVARPLADAGAAVLLVDHSTKANDNPLHPSGSKRKRAAIGGASYLVTAPKPLSREQGGRLRLTCAKDRHGAYRRNEVVGDLVIDVTVTGTRIELYAPSEPGVTHLSLADVVIDALTRHAAPCNKRALRGMIRAKTKASNDSIDDAVELLVAKGRIIESAGSHGARLFAVPSSVKGEES